MIKKLLFGSTALLLGLNLFFGTRLHLYAGGGDAENPYEQYRLFSEVLEKVRQDYVDGENLTYKELVQSALKGMLNSLDPHSEYMVPTAYKDLKDDTQGEFSGIGIVVNASKDGRLVVVSPMDDSPSSRAGILAGDRLVKIDGRSTVAMSFDDAVKRLRGRTGSQVVVTVERKAGDEEMEEKEFTLTRAVIKVSTVKDINGHSEFPLGENAVGYVKLTQFGEQTSADLEKALQKLEKQGMQALILDLRNNPGGLLEQAGEVAEKFLPRGQLVVSTEGRGAEQRSEYIATGKTKQRKLPMVVLVNGGSASASEIVAGCLQDLQKITRAVILGEQTFGKGSVQSIAPLRDGSALRLTTAKYYTPSHRVIHERGITPDIVVPMSEEDERALAIQRSPGSLERFEEPERSRLAAVRDVQFDRAMDLLKGITLYTKGVLPDVKKVADAKAAVQSDAP
jgi:carboxyl-terminal processing protease